MTYLSLFCFLMVPVVAFAGGTTRTITSAEPGVMALMAVGGAVWWLASRKRR